MAMIDVRPPVDLDQAIRLNLAMAENPRKHIETVPPVGIEIHDTPIEGHYEDTTTKARKWRKLLTARVKDLDWLPKIRKTGSDDLFSIGGEPPVSKVLIYPVAAWAANAVDTVLTEMDDIVLKKAGGKRLDPSGQIKFKLATERWQAAGY